MANFAPSAFAVRTMAPPRSSRSGLPLISRYTLRRAACDATRSKSNGNGSRLQQNAAGGMAHHAQRRGFERAHQTVGHFRSFQIHVAVDAADHDVQLGQRVFGQVHRAVAADVAFEA